MQRLTEVLRQAGLTRAKTTEKVRAMEIFEILELARELSALVPIEPPIGRDVSAFDFVADSEMAAQHGTCCFAPECRLKRIRSTARFAATYCTTIWIPNYFANYPDPSNSMDHADQVRTRAHFTGDVLIMWELSELLRLGIVRFTPPRLDFCEEHLVAYGRKTLGQRFEEAIEAIADEYAGKGSARLEIKKLASGNFTPAFLSIKGYRGIFDELPGTLLSRRPNWMTPDQARLLFRKGTLRLTPSMLAAAGIPHARIAQAAFDIAFQVSEAEAVNAKCLTHRSIDFEIMRRLNPDIAPYSSTDTLVHHMTATLPIFTDAPINAIAKLRRSETDAFLVFQNTLTKTLRDEIKPDTEISSKMAKRIYEQALYPQLRELESKANEIRGGALFAGGAQAALGFGALAVGLFAGFVPETAAVTLKLGGTLLGGSGATKSLTELLRKPKEVRNHNYFFLWKLGATRLARRKRS